MTDLATTTLSEAGNTISEMPLEEAQAWMTNWIDTTWTMSSKNVKAKHERDLLKKTSSAQIQQYCWDCVLSGLNGT